MKRLLSLLVVLVMLLSLCVIAVNAEGTSIEYTIKLYSTNFDEDLGYTVKEEVSNVNQGDYLIARIYADNILDTDTFQYAINVDSNVFEVSSDDDSALEYYQDYYWISEDGESDYHSYAEKEVQANFGKHFGAPELNYKNNQFVFVVAASDPLPETVKVSRADTPYKYTDALVGSYILKVKDTVVDGTKVTVDIDKSFSKGRRASVGSLESATSVPANITVGETQPDEEVFGIEETAKVLEGSEMMKDATGGKVEAAGDKVVAIFAKNVTSETLAAESYGIIFGGKRYPGILAVDPGKAWAVKLVGSSTQLPAGNYEYGVYAGGAEVMSDEAWVVD